MQLNELNRKLKGVTTYKEFMAFHRERQRSIPEKEYIYAFDTLREQNISDAGRSRMGRMGEADDLPLRDGSFGAIMVEKWGFSESESEF